MVLGGVRKEPKHSLEVMVLSHPEEGRQSDGESVDPPPYSHTCYQTGCHYYWVLERSRDGHVP